MVALMPDHVLEQKDWMIIVKVHLMTCFHSALDRVSHGLGAVVQKLCHANRIRFCRPLFPGYGKVFFGLKRVVPLVCIRALALAAPYRSECSVPGVRSCHRDLSLRSRG